MRGCLSELWRGGKGRLPQGCEQGVKRLFLDFCPSFLPNFPLPPLCPHHSLTQAECWVGLAEQTRTLTVPSSVFIATRGALSCLKGCVRQKSPEQHFTNLLGTWVQVHQHIFSEPKVLLPGGAHAAASVYAQSQGVPVIPPKVTGVLSLRGGRPPQPPSLAPSCSYRWW